MMVDSRKTISAGNWQVARKVATIYALVAGTWILLSDRVLLWFLDDPALLTRLQTAKGWFFVVVTALLLAFLINRYVSALRWEDRKVREANELFENIISNIPVYVFWKDKDSRYLGCNQRFATVAGVRRKEAIAGKTDLDLAWKTKEAELTRQIDQKVMRRGEPLLDLEETQLQADGREATFLSSRVPLRDDSGSVVGILGIYIDITERKRNEEITRDSKRNLATLIAHLPCMVYRCRNDWKRTMECVSKGSKELTGYLPEEFTDNGKISYDDLIHPEDRDALRLKIEKAVREKGVFRHEYTIRTADGEERRVLEQGRPIFSTDGQLQALAGLIIDTSFPPNCPHDLSGRTQE
jgi:PAS domain S-box-containing protein